MLKIKKRQKSSMTCNSYINYLILFKYTKNIYTDLIIKHKNLFISFILFDNLFQNKSDNEIIIIKNCNHKNLSLRNLDSEIDLNKNEDYKIY